MKTSFRIGERSFSSKKDALIHYKGILNSYEFGQSLIDNDFKDLMALLNYEHQLSLSQTTQIEVSNEVEDAFEKDSEVQVENIFVSRVQFNTKCFEVFYSDEAV